MSVTASTRVQIFGKVSLKPKPLISVWVIPPASLRKGPVKIKCKGGGHFVSNNSKVKKIRLKNWISNKALDKTKETTIYTKPELIISKGDADVLGPSLRNNGVNFALYAKHALQVSLCIFDEDGNNINEFDLMSQTHRTGDIWHALLEGLQGDYVIYGYRVKGEGGWNTGNRWDASKVLLDPYAPLVWGRKRFGVRDKFEAFKDNDGSRFLGMFEITNEKYDWGENYKKPNIPQQDLIIYELPIRSFTADASSQLPVGERGTFKGIQEKIEHLVELGVNAVELLPVFEYDELEFQRYKNPRDHMVNVWGYSHINFFAPMSRYATHGRGPTVAAKEFKDMVRTFHENGIEVILDVVYNHTAESDDKNPYLISFRGIDNQVYYMVDTNSYVQLINYSGCGNTVNANHPVVTQLILDSLRNWVNEYHVDGFRFDLASCLCRDGLGHPLASPPLIKAICQDPVLKNVKLIAEPWDLGMYQVGSFPNWDIWAEWNGKYRDDIRRFIKGDIGMKKAFAMRLSGSSDLYNVNNRKPYHSINFVVAHDGFTLRDLVSYNYKHNQANGENNCDGSNDNFSWNCGHEGDTGDLGILRLREKQIRNFLVALMVSQGTPMILAGDEYGASRDGNNNWYGHDSKMTHFLWDHLEKEKSSLFRFFSELIKFRRSHASLRQKDFIRSKDITWHEDNWDNDESRFLAFTLHDNGSGSGDIFCAFNAHGYQINMHLPKGKAWKRLVDTNLAPPKDITPGGNTGVEPVYGIAGYSSIVLICK